MPEPAYTIVGCGYTGLRLSLDRRRAGSRVTGLVRSADGLRRLAAAGVEGRRVDLDAPAARDLAGVAAGRRIVYMVPPPPTGDRDPRIAAFLDALPEMPDSLVYLSTTGVYGDRGGARVDEDDAPSPRTDRGRRRLDAEETCLAWGQARGVPVTVLRVPGIYGPGRLPLERLARGEPVPDSDDPRPGNRIHVDDLVTACVAAAGWRGERQVFNVGDGDHRGIGIYFRVVAEAAGVPLPGTLPWDEFLARATPGMRSFLEESRRVDNRRMREGLGVALTYPDMESGVRASLAEETGHPGPVSP